MTNTAKILYGCGADSYYAIKMDVPDPYLWYQDIRGETHVVMSPLEVDRARKNAQVDHVHSMSEIIKDLQSKGKSGTVTEQILWLISQDNPEHVIVPRDFPFALGVNLQQKNISIKASEGAFFPERSLKTTDEVAKIHEAQALNEKAFQKAFSVLEESTIDGQSILQWQGAVLTAEILRGQMNAVIAAGGGMPSDVIVACGAQGADPHERGHGALKAHELIILDSWPRGASGNFYHGDLTRTVLKGTPTKAQVKLYNTVKEAQQMALEMISPKVTGVAVHEAIQQHFEKSGFKTGVDEQGRQVGFFHGTGHSIGLEVHDQGPGISSKRADVKSQGEKLQAGLVVTVEPGLYYPELGGVRIEDIVHVTENGIENLTKLPKELVIL